MSELMIESLRPIGAGFWKAQIAITGKEEIAGRAFGSSLNITFRFQYDPEGDVLGLLKKAISEAELHHAKASAALHEADISAENLTEQP